MRNEANFNKMLPRKSLFVQLLPVAAVAFAAPCGEQRAC